MKDQAIDLVINLLRAKDQITSLEKDILDTHHELNKQPFDMNSAYHQIQSNDISHPDVWAAVSALPTTGQKKATELTENDLRYVLSRQLSFLLEKEAEECKK